MMMINKSAIIIALVVIPSNVVQSCTDSETYTFGTYKLFDSVSTRDCEWITENVFKLEEQKVTWCD